MSFTRDAVDGPDVRGRAAQDSESLASRFAALGESKRMGILASLSAGERCACDLTGCCGDRQPLLSFHLKKLRESGLVEARRDGRWMHYSINRDALRELADALHAIADGEVAGPRCC